MLRWRLSVLMFLQYAPGGAVVPFFTLRMQELGFTPMQMAWSCLTQALAALAGPLIVGQFADRWCPAQRCLCVLSLLGGGVLWWLADLTGPLAFFAGSLAFWLTMGPAVTLGTSISFAHLADAERGFGPVRLWGTVGWVVSGWLLGYWFAQPGWLCDLVRLLRPAPAAHNLGDAFRLGGLFFVGLGLYALTLPHTPPARHAVARFAPLAAVELLRSRSFAIYCLCTLGMSITLPFNSQVTPLLLKSLDVPLKWLGPTLTLGQSMEVVSLAVLPVMLGRLGVRSTMIVGILAWLALMVVLTLGAPLWLVIAALPLNGVCVCGYFVAGQVFINSRAHGDIRASAQGLFSFITGLGLLVGNLVVGAVRGLDHEAFAPTFAVSLTITALLGLVFLVGFHEEEEAAEEPVGTAARVASD